MLGGIIGGLTGGIGSSTFTFTYPTLSLASTSIGTTAVVVGTGTATVGGLEMLSVLGAAGVVMFASSNRPGDNKKQNKQFKDAMNEFGVTDKDKMRRVHDKIKGRNMGYNELIEFIKKILGLS